MKYLENSFVIMPLLFVILIAIAGCTLPQYPGEVPDEEIEFKEIPRFASLDDMIEKFRESQETNQNKGGVFNDVLRSSAVPTAAESASDSGATYSETNVQVAGVDEGDIVKTDGKHVYTISGNKLIIVDAFPIETAKILSETELEMTPREMFVSGDNLLIFGTENRAFFSVVADFYYGGNTAVKLYDISDRENPKLEKEITFEGNYLTSRLINKQSYFVINSFPNYNIIYQLDQLETKKTNQSEIERIAGFPVPETGEKEEVNPEDLIPNMVEDGVEKKIALPEEIGYLPPEPFEKFVTIVSLNIETGEMEKETIVGKADNVFASKNSLYLASTIWRNYGIPTPRPLIGVPVSSKPVAGVPVTTDEYQEPTEKTNVVKFGLNDGKIGFVGKGSVPGRILNQFAMDEFEGNFRIATTIGHVSRGGEAQSTNNLYILDKSLELLGKVEDLAPGERIYSTRFIGEKAYMVTFKKVDPLFVIDVSDPKNPKVLGKLKIPGYSDYLHPLDDNHIIGVGKDTIEAQKGDFAWYQGLKMAIFDVSDVSNPIEKHKIIIGDRGTDSYALRDHKAFLFDREKELLVLPIQLALIDDETKQDGQFGFDFPAYGNQVFQGAFVFNVTAENGFVEKGRITHVSDEEELKRGYYFRENSSVKRSLFIGDILYTVSNRLMKANSLLDLAELREFVFLDEEEDNFVPEPGIIN